MVPAAPALEAEVVVLELELELPVQPVRLVLRPLV